MINAVELRAQDGVILRAQEAGRGPTWIILVHDRGEDLDVWAATSEMLGAEGWSTLAVDLRGHGMSEGEWNSDLVPDDLARAVGRARSQGADVVVVIASGSVSPVALSAAQIATVDGLVLLSPNLDATQLKAERLPSLGHVLIIAGSQDKPCVKISREIHSRLTGWRLIVLLPVMDRNSALIGGHRYSLGAEHVRALVRLAAAARE